MYRDIRDQLLAEQVSENIVSGKRTNSSVIHRPLVERVLRVP